MDLLKLPFPLSTIQVPKILSDFSEVKSAQNIYFPDDKRTWARALNLDCSRPLDHHWDFYGAISV